MSELDFFSSVNFLEPKCPSCGVVLDYGANTEYVEKVKTHLCLGCGHQL